MNNAIATAEITTWKNDGAIDRVYFRGDFLFSVQAGLGAKAAKMQDRCWREQSRSHYTAAARINFQIEQLHGYALVVPGTNN